MASHLLAIEGWDTVERRAVAGALVKTWVASELRKLCALGSPRTDLYFWHTHAGREVDCLLERGPRLAAIEGKWTQRINDADIAGMNACRADLGPRLALCVILYASSTAFAPDEHTVAVPLPLFFGHP